MSTLLLQGQVYTGVVTCVDADTLNERTLAYLSSTRLCRDEMHAGMVDGRTLAQ